MHARSKTTACTFGPREMFGGSSSHRDHVSALNLESTGQIYHSPAQCPKNGDCSKEMPVLNRKHSHKTITITVNPWDFAGLPWFPPVFWANPTSFLSGIHRKRFGERRTLRFRPLSSWKLGKFLQRSGLAPHWWWWYTYQVHLLYYIYIIDIHVYIYPNVPILLYIQYMYNIYITTTTYYDDSLKRMVTCYKPLCYAYLP